MKRKICVVTGTRAEYGLLYWLIKEIKDDLELQLQLIATGMHMSTEFGLTYRLIEQDGFYIDEKIEMLLSSDTPVGIAKSIGLGIISFADALERLKPDVMIVLGDRYEILAAVQAAMALRIPIAHISGGESTVGAMDEAIRHSISKMAHLHFVGAQDHRRRVIQLGEQPSRVFFVGEPGLENIRRLSLLSRTALEMTVGIPLHSPLFLVTYHPVTLRPNQSAHAIVELLTALNRFPEATILLTMPNSDTEGRAITDKIKMFVADRPEKTRFFTSMGQVNYLSALSHADIVIGNSSSGLIEAPYLHVATVNIGDRQQGRLKAVSVIDCNEEADSITTAIHQALSPQFRQLLNTVICPYGDADTSRQVVHYLKTVDLSSLLMKEFYDITIPGI